MPAPPGTDAPVGSPRWWLGYLNAKLEAERGQLDTYDNYYEGQHPLLFATPKFREAFGDLFSAFADNWCEVVVDASAERLQVEGFRVGDDEDADADLWEDWQRNGLDAESSAAMLEAIKLGRAAVIVEPTADGPLVTVEHPSQVYVEYDPGNRRRRVAALKKWIDSDGTVYATVYLPGAAHRFQTDKPASGVVAAGSEWVDRRDEPAFVDYSRVFGDLVPVVGVRNRSGILRPHTSDLQKVIPLQNAINKLATDMIVASEFAAFRQRLLTGVEIPRYPEGHVQQGEPMNEAYLSGVSRLWVVEEADAKAQEFAASDLTIYVKAVDMFVQHVAAQTRTPPHYLMGTIVNASGDALKAAETGLVKKVRGKARYMGQDHEDVATLMYLARDEAEKAKATKEVLWADMESRSMAEMVDAAVKLKDIGVPFDALWQRIGASAQERKRWKSGREAELASAMAAALAGTRPGDQGVAADAATAPNDATASGGASAGQ